jgi:hypothetical protein
MRRTWARLEETSGGNTWKVPPSYPLNLDTLLSRYRDLLVKLIVNKAPPVLGLEKKTFVSGKGESKAVLIGRRPGSGVMHSTEITVALAPPTLLYISITVKFDGRVLPVRTYKTNANIGGIASDVAGLLRKALKQT